MTLNYQRLDNWQLAIPTNEHYLPLPVALGAMHVGDHVGVFNNYRELGSMDTSCSGSRFLHREYGGMRYITTSRTTTNRPSLFRAVRLQATTRRLLDTVWPTFFTRQNRAICSSLDLVRTVVDTVSNLLTFTAGTMIYAVAEELILKISEEEHSNVGTIAFVLGFTAMMVLGVTLS